MMAKFARLAAAAALAVFLGAMLTEGLVLVPYWRSLPAEDFFRWYAANDQRLIGFFGPVTTTMGLLSLAAAAGSVWEGHPRRWAAVIAATLAITAIAMFFLYFEHANSTFSAASLSPTALPAELTRWATWHWTRTALAAAAVIASFRALVDPAD